MLKRKLILEREPNVTRFSFTRDISIFFAYVYVTVRGVKKFVVLRPEYDVLTICQIVDCGGDYPRDMILSKDMKYALVANTDSGNICMFCVEDGLMDDKCCGHIRLERGEFYCAT